MKRSTKLMTLSTTLVVMFLFVTVSVSAFSGLPEGFEPEIGYTHDFNGGRIILVDSDLNWFISNNGENFISIQPDPIFPDNFVPHVAYYHPFNGGRVVLLAENGDAFIYNSNDKEFKELILESPVNGPMEIGYYHGFGGGRVVLEDNDNSYVYNPNTKEWNIFALGSFGLPNEASVLSYYVSSNNEVHKWYADGSVFVYDGSGDFEDVTESVNGLTPGFVPSAGYYDSINNQIVLWFGDEAYVSSDGREFDSVDFSDDDNGDDDNNDGDDYGDDGEDDEDSEDNNDNGDNNSDDDNGDNNDLIVTNRNALFKEFMPTLDSYLTTAEICAVRGDCPDQKTLVVNHPNGMIELDNGVKDNSNGFAFGVLPIILILFILIELIFFVSLVRR